jgi:hypothetical protein
VCWAKGFGAPISATEAFNSGGLCEGCLYEATHLEETLRERAAREIGMRDTFATLHLAAGIRLEWISKQMGHSSTTVTERHYARWLRSGEDAELDRMNSALSQTGQKSASRAAEAK